MKLKLRETIVVRKIGDEHSSEHCDSSMPKEYCEYVKKHGFHFTPELAMHASKMMKNADGSEHCWSVSQVSSAISTKDIGSHKCTIGDITYAANMAYADFFPRVIKEASLCIDYAIALAKDPDGYEGQIFARWITDVKHKNLYNSIDWTKYE